MISASTIIRHGWTLGAVVLVLCVNVAPAHAQVSAPGTWHVTPFLGPTFKGDLEETTTSVGVAVGTAWTHDLGLEAEFAVVPNLVSRDGTFDALLLGGHVLYEPVKNAPVLPYALIGGDFVRLSSDTSQAGTPLEVALTLGGGVWVPMRGRVASRADLRFIHVNNAPNFWRAYYGVTIRLSGAEPSDGG